MAKKEVEEDEFDEGEVEKGVDKKGAKEKSGKVYHVSKRAKDNKWQIRIRDGKKAIKLFDTKVQAEEYARTLAENQNASVVFHKSKGPNKGKMSKR